MLRCYCLTKTGDLPYQSLLIPANGKRGVVVRDLIGRTAGGERGKGVGWEILFREMS